MRHMKHILGFAAVILLSPLPMMSPATQPAHCSTQPSEIIASYTAHEISLDATHPASEWRNAHPIVFCSDWQGKNPDEQRETQKIRDVVRRVHNDYTEWSGPQRVREIMGEEAEELLRGRFAIIQVWRPINHPVECFPLAICDAQTVKPETLVVNERRYPGRIGQTYGITYDPGQRWYWFPHMRPDEALVFKVYESLKDGRARWTAHTAFEDPTSPPHARPRESIEIRTLAFF